MAVRKQRNYAGHDPSCNNGDGFVGCNLSQPEPGTKICKGRKGLKFVRCNLARARVPEGSIIEDCNTSQVPLPEEPDQKTARLEAIDAQIDNLVDEKQALLAEAR